jgi:uncharacterized protein (TIGR02265 family)
MPAMPLELPRRKEPVAFDQMMEGLLVHVMKDRLDAQARQRLRGLGVDMDQPLRSAYPLEVLIGTIHLCAGVLHPGVPREESWYRLGRQTLEGFGSTGMGKALFGMARTWGARRMLGHMTRVFQTAINYARARSYDLPGGDVDLTVEVLPEFRDQRRSRRWMDPHFVRGIITQMVEVCGARVPVTLLSPVDPSGFILTYRVPLSQVQPEQTPPVSVRRAQ